MQMWQVNTVQAACGVANEVGHALSYLQIFQNLGIQSTAIANHLITGN